MAQHTGGRWAGSVALAAAIGLGSGCAVADRAGQGLAADDPVPVATDLPPATSAPARPRELIVNGGFGGGRGTAPWRGDGRTRLTVKDGRLRVWIMSVTKRPEDVRLRQGGLRIAEGQRYRLSFEASSSAKVTLGVAVRPEREPEASLLERDLPLGASPRPFRFEFAAATTAAVEVAFLLGGAGCVWFVVDDVSLTAL